MEQLRADFNEQMVGLIGTLVTPSSFALVLGVTVTACHWA